MPEQNKSKPKIEDFIHEYLGDMQKNALDFVAYLRANKMSISKYSKELWMVKYKSIRMCFIKLYMENEYDTLPDGNYPAWSINPNLIINNSHKYLNDNENLIISEGLQNIIWDNLIRCRFGEQGEGKGCSPGKACGNGTKVFTVIGKKITGVCSGCEWTTGINDPDETTINGIKRLLELKKKAIDD